MNLDEELITHSFVKNDLVYLNNASSSMIPLQTIKAMTDFALEYNMLGPDSIGFTNVLMKKSNQLRQSISKIIKCKPEEVIFTSSTTEGINAVANGMRFPENSNIIIRGTRQEHHSNYYPWLRLAKTVKLQNLTSDKDGFFEISELEKVMSKDTKLVALSHGLYNTGSILPAKEIGRILQEQGIPYLLDAAQTVGCIGEYDFASTNADFIVFNGYKWLCGPMGIGIFVCKKDSALMLEPVNLAGESAILYDNDKLAFKDVPDRFQGGFRNFVAIAGLENSISFLIGLGFQNIRNKIIVLADLLREELQKIPDVTLYGPEENQKRTSIVSFTIKQKAPKEIVEMLEKRKFVLAVREISDTKVVRASPHLFNTESEILRLVDTIKRI